MSREVLNLTHCVRISKFFSFVLESVFESVGSFCASPVSQSRCTAVRGIPAHVASLLVGFTYQYSR